LPENVGCGRMSYRYWLCSPKQGQKLKKKWQIKQT